MEKKSVLVGLSGGVDSALCAKLLKDAGYEVSGVFFRFCSNADPSGAVQVAKKLEIPIHVIDHRRAFQNKVVRPFKESYLAGETPNPCVNCNRRMKIKALIDAANALGIDKVATGHYARIAYENGRWCILRALDPKKDQSYFLWRLTQNQLSRLVFPLADWEKEAVKTEMENIVPKKQKESMDVCFIPRGDYADFLAENLSEKEKEIAFAEGDFVTPDGKVLGRHKGIARYTVGQRRGLGIALGERAFVTRIDPVKREVVVGDPASLLVSSQFVSDLNFVSCRKSEIFSRTQFVKGRHRAAFTPCRIEKEGDGVRVWYHEPQKRIAPGQSVCFYDEKALLFGGIAQKN